MVYKSPSQLKKEQNKGRESRRDAKLRERRELQAMSESEKKKLDVSRIQSSIKNCEYDLAGPFKGHSGITNKLKALRENLVIAEQEVIRLQAQEKEQAEAQEKEVVAEEEVTPTAENVVTEELSQITN